jgi:hypothetical protein
MALIRSRFSRSRTPHKVGPGHWCLARPCIDGGLDFGGLGLHGILLG